MEFMWPHCFYHTCFLFYLGTENSLLKTGWMVNSLCILMGLFTCSPWLGILWWDPAVLTTNTWRRNCKANTVKQVCMQNWQLWILEMFHQFLKSNCLFQSLRGFQQSEWTKISQRSDFNDRTWQEIFKQLLPHFLKSTPILYSVLHSSLYRLTYWNKYKQKKDYPKFLANIVTFTNKSHTILRVNLGVNQNSVKEDKK